MSAIARQRSDSSPQKIKANLQPNFSEAAEAESKLEEDRKRRDEDAAKKREERRRLDELQRRKDEAEAEEAARRIVDSASRIARIKLEEQQRQQNFLQAPADETPQLCLPTPAAAVDAAPRDESVASSRPPETTSPVKKYLRNELRCYCT
jgi:translation initiation factor IF-2